MGKLTMSKKQIAKLFADSNNLANDMQLMFDENDQRFEELETQNEDLKKRVDQLEKIIQELCEERAIEHRPPKSSPKKEYKIVKRPAQNRHNAYGAIEWK